jgi:hypothetical protein
LALGALGNEKEIRFLDPALGTGSFFSALLSMVSSERMQTAEGYEIDPHYGLPSQDLWKHTPLQVHITDFMGRSDTKSNRPFRFILNHSKAIAANIYLMLYPKPLLTHALQDDPALLRRIWESLNTLPADALIDEGRVYGGGLHKMEPKELANVPMASIANHIPSDIRNSVSLQLAFGDLS